MTETSADYTPSLGGDAEGNDSPEWHDRPQPPDLEAIEARLKAATEGPWEADEANPWTPHQRSSFADYGASIYGLAGEMTIVVGGSQDEQGGSVGVLTNEDARFIAHSWSDIRALLAEVRRLWAENEVWEKHGLVQIVKERDSLRSLLEVEQRARWQAEQDRQHWQEKVADLQTQVEQLAQALEMATGISSTGG